MKKLASLTAIAMLLGSMSIAMPASAEATTYDLGAGWTVTALDGSLSDDTHYVEITDKESHSGNYSLHWNYSEGTGSDEIYRYTILHDANPTGIYSDDWGEKGKFKVEFYAKSNSFDWYNNPDFMYYNKIGPFDNPSETSINGTRIRLSSEKIAWSEPDENGWRKGTFYYQYPYNWGKPQFYILLGGLANDMYLDDISVTYAGTEDFKDLSLLADGGFELVTPTGEELSDYGWHVAYNTANVNEARMPSAEIVADGKGNKMLHVTAPDPGNGWQKEIALRREIATNMLDIGWGTYAIKFKIRGAYSSNHLEAGCGAYNDLLRGLNNSNYVTTKKLDDGWTEYTVITGGENTGNGNSLNSFRFNVYGYCNSFYIDDFTVYKVNDGVAAAGDHLYNGTFDNEKTNANIEASGWAKVVNALGDNRYLTTRSNKFAYTGTNSMFFSAPGSWVDQKFIQFYQVLPSNYDAAKEYTLKLKMRTINPETALYCYYASNSTNGKVSDKIEFKSSNAEVKSLGNDWYQYTVTLPALSSADAAYKLAFEAMSAVDGIWIDDISVTDAEGKEYITNGSFEDYEKYVIGNPYMLDGDYLDIDAPVAGENYLYVPIKTNVAGLNYYVYFAIYKDGSLYKITKASYENAAVGEKEVEAMLELDTVGDGAYTAKAFVWDKNMAPYINKAEF